MATDRHLQVRHCAFILAYLLWIGITRLILTLLLSCSGHRIGPAYPVILYYNQIVGALVKILRVPPP